MRRHLEGLGTRLFYFDVLDETMVRMYIRNQEDEDECYEQMKNWAAMALRRLNKPPALPGHLIYRAKG